MIGWTGSFEAGRHGTQTAMPENYAEETRATARVGNLDIEILHGRSADGSAEHLAIHVEAVPSFAAFGRLIEMSNPFLFWMRFAGLAWTPWLPAALPQRQIKRIEPKPDSGD
ncbi:MAG: hypothetical protein FWC84_06270 [Alphaproteobacteria bacterium]|nr:hypothetical protein [Alphaproteobacteria bacterium]